MTAFDSASVAANIEAVEARIAAIAAGRAVRLVCVTKGFGRAAIDAVRASGLVDVGENFAQEVRDKSAALNDMQLHFIGRLQTNKVRLIAPMVSCWQSVDRLSLAQEIARRAPGAAVLVQVNVAHESGKGGCEPAFCGDLVSACWDLGLRVEGLMGVGRRGTPSEARPGFALLRSLVSEFGLRECSMGMTDDLEVAVVAGSTMVRVGSAIFGPRP